MKKIFGLILSAAVLGTVLTACGGSGAGVKKVGEGLVNIGNTGRALRRCRRI